MESLVGNKKALEEIVSSPGIAGDEDLGILEVFKRLASPGSLVRVWPQRFATAEVTCGEYPTSLLVIAHADTNGLRVSRITEDGFLRFRHVGGISPLHYLSSVVYVWARLGRRLARIAGVVGWKAIHNFEEGEEKKVPKSKQLVIDIGAKNKAEVESLGIRIGDPITFDPQITYLKNGLVAANGLDNRSGVWAVLEVLHQVCQEEVNLRLVFAVAGKEEIGLIGAQQIEGLYHPFKFCIGVDAGHANDYPGDADLKSTGPDIALGKGPIIYRGSILDRELVEKAINLAKARQIPYQLESLSIGIGTDAVAFERKGVRTIHFGIPCRYMHFKEVVSLSDLKNTADLISALIREIDGR